MNKRTIEMKVSKEGFVTNEEVHDAEIESVHVGRSDMNKKIVSVFCKSEDGLKFVVQMEDVKFFNMNLLIQQNVISDLYVINKIDPGENLTSIENIEKYTFESYQSLTHKIKSGELFLVKFIPSVGCEIAAVCQNVEMYHG